jgi:transcriptional regulator with XRE-family HTH domain
MEFGRRLRDLRKKKGMTLEALAARIGSSKGYLSGIENEKVNPPTEKFVRKIARIFGQDEVDFLKLAYLDKIPRALQPELRKALGQEAAPAAGPGRRRPGEDSGVVPSVIPLLNTAALGYPARIDSRGFPEALVRDSIQIPGVHPTQTFALTVCGDAMVSESSLNLKSGDIVLASRSARAQSGDLVFAVVTEKGQRQGVVRQVLFQDNEIYALQAARGDVPVIFAKRGDIDGMFKVIGRIEFFGNAVPDLRTGKRAEPVGK